MPFKAEGVAVGHENSFYQDFKYPDFGPFFEYISDFFKLKK